MKNKEVKIGTIISLDLPQISSCLFSIGFEFIVIDLEHGSVSDETIASIILSKNQDCKVFVRISDIKEVYIKHALDMGCDGIVAPRVENLNEIQTLIDYSFYPPIGKRSIGFGSANKYGLKFKDYIENFQPIVLAQVESVKGLEIVKEIVSTENIAGLFIGPYDLSMSLGIPGQFESKIFRKANEIVRKLCMMHDKHFCTFTLNAQSAIEEMSKGSDMIVVGVDGNLFLNNYSQLINSIKNA